ncbi:MAG: 3-deoxy-D-manno-octulosonic acid transferase [Gemmatimonadaceae bacterium]
MHPLYRFAYLGAGQLARAGSAVSGLLRAPGGKLVRGLRARAGLRPIYAAWGTLHRDASRPLLWLHAPSVGEGLQARPVLEIVRSELPDTQLAYTYFSPSAERFAGSLAVDFRQMLPFDTPGDVESVLSALRPTALVYSKLDVWPLLTERASVRGVRLGLISATVAPRSSRLSHIGRSLLREAYARIDAVGAVDAVDAERLVEIGARRDAIMVTGDTRYDQVWRRVEHTDRKGALLAPLASARPTLVAGSTWPADEKPLLGAWRALRTRGARLIIAPHEPTERALVAVEQWGAASGLRLARLGAAEADTADVVLVDRVGVLGDLYALADVAYVGGGFHRAGLHSVIEPAAFGVPVLFGPRNGSSRDAALLLSAEGAAAVRTQGEIVARLDEWLGNGSSRDEAGRRARTVVRAGLGATARSFALVRRLLRD